MIKITAKKTEHGFTGYVHYYNDKFKVWSKSCKIVRLTKADALTDAEWLKKEMQP